LIFLKVHSHSWSAVWSTDFECSSYALPLALIVPNMLSCSVS
jgi:hypothetical protein